MYYTYPNQRTINVHKVKLNGDFLGIKNDVWKAACKDLRPHAFVLYLYLAANSNGYQFALSPADVLETIGMARSTYHDQFKILINKGYLVLSHGNTYDFYEVPQRDKINNEIETATVGQCDENYTFDGFENTTAASCILSEDTEINNINNPTDRIINMEDFYREWRSNSDEKILDF